MSLLNTVLHLLLVEDNPADVLLIREGLRRSGIAADIRIAGDGEYAELLLREPTFPLDFVLLDLNVPRCDGLQLLERFQGVPGLSFVVFTSSVNPDDRERALALGALEYVVKPTSASAFITAICQIMQRWSLANSSTTAAGN